MSNMQTNSMGIGDKTFEFKARIFKVLGDANRMRILEFLRDGEKCQCEIIPLIDQSQPTVSRHLRLLEEAGLITSKRDGNRMFYRAADERVYGILDVLEPELLHTLSQGLMRRLLPL